MKKDQIPKEILARIEDEMLSGERLLWAGIPRRKHVPNSMTEANAAITGILLGLMVLGLAAFMFMESSTGADDPATFYTLFGIVTLVVLMSIVKILPQLQNTKNLVYAISNRRAIILRKNRVQSFAAKDLQFIERTMHRDGSGDIIFREEHYKRLIPAGGAIMHQKKERVTTGFYGIENPAEVEAIMLETFQGDPDQSRLYDFDEEENDLYDADEEQQVRYK